MLSNLHRNKHLSGEFRDPSIPEIVTATIATRNFLGKARTLVRTLRRQHASAECYVLIVDDEGQICDCEDFELVRLSDLAIPDVEAFCFQYTAFELCNSLKPLLLNWILNRRNARAVLYLDADIGVFGSMLPVWREVLSHDIFLTPHTTTGYPEDGHFPDSSSLKWAGRFNAGVMGVRASDVGQKFLLWWARRLRHGCLDQPERGFFVDQKHLDSASQIFENIEICKHPGVNVAHFNLHERRLECDEVGWRVDDQRLLCFHFTCVDLARGDFCNPVTRPITLDQPVVRDLIVEYATELEKSGSTEQNEVPYGFARYNSDRLISGKARRAFRQFWLTQIASDVCASLENPFLDDKWENVSLALDKT